MYSYICLGWNIDLNVFCWLFNSKILKPVRVQIDQHCMLFWLHLNTANIKNQNNNLSNKKSSLLNKSIEAWTYSTFPVSRAMETDMIRIAVDLAVWLWRNVSTARRSIDCAVTTRHRRQWTSQLNAPSLPI